MGNGPHLVFLHGFCEDSSIWESLIASFSKSHTCLNIDLPGFGDSQSLSFTSIVDIATSVYQVLLTENAKGSILLGHSLGGYVACELNTQYPYFFKGLGLIHSTSHPDTPTKKSNRKKSIDFIQKHGTSNFFNQFMKNLVAEDNLSLLPNKLKSIIMNTPTRSVINGLIAMMNRTDYAQILPQLTTPVLFIIGEKDHFYNPDDIYTQASRCAIAQIDIIKNAGHLSMIENKDSLITAIQRFVKLNQYIQ